MKNRMVCNIYLLGVFLLIKTLLIKNNKKREAALKNEAGGVEKRAFFFTWPYSVVALLLSLVAEQKRFSWRK